MGNLHGKFVKGYLNYNGFIDPARTILVVFDDSGEREYMYDFKLVGNPTKEELSQVFDDFYGGTFSKRSGEYTLIDIPVRTLFFETGGNRKLIAIGHVQKDAWISVLYEKITTEKEIVNDYINQYLKNVLHDFPHFVDKFLHIFKNNPYEICNYLNLEQTDPLDSSEIFKQAFLKIAQKQE